jgi:Mg2+/Co2+ transporter CorC
MIRRDDKIVSRAASTQELFDRSQGEDSRFNLLSDRLDTLENLMLAKDKLPLLPSDASNEDIIRHINLIVKMLNKDLRA